MKLTFDQLTHNGQYSFDEVPPEFTYISLLVDYRESPLPDNTSEEETERCFKLRMADIKRGIQLLKEDAIRELVGPYTTEYKFIRATNNTRYNIRWCNLVVFSPTAWSIVSLLIPLWKQNPVYLHGNYVVGR